MAEAGAGAAPLQQKIKASGFMWKRGHRVKNWKRRWFILRDAYLAYFEAPTKTNQAPKGVLPVGGCEIAENAFSQTGFSHSFVLTTSIGVYMFRCDTQTEAADWLTKLKQSKTLFAGLEKLTGAGLDPSDRKKLFQKIWFEQFRKGLRKSRQSFKRAGFETNLPARVFGVPLPTLVAREGRLRGGVPIWAGRLIEYLDARALRLQGLFRVSGHGDEIAAIRLLIESGEEFHLEARVRDPHSVAALLKLFIRELPEPLVPYALYDAFLDVPSQPDPAARLALLRRLIAQLPWEHRALLQRLLHLLVRVADHAAENSMGVQNICICWAPNVFRADEAKRADIMQGIRDAPLLLAAFKELLERYAELFPASTLAAFSSGGGSGGGSSGGGVASSSPVSPSPVGVAADGADAAEMARRRKENRNAKMHIQLTDEPPPVAAFRPASPRAASPNPPERVASPPPLAAADAASYVSQFAPPPPPPGLALRLPPPDRPPGPATTHLPPAPAPLSPRSMMRLAEAAQLPPPPPVPAVGEDSQPEASMSRALLGKMMESFTPREVSALDADIDATAAHLSPSSSPPQPSVLAPRPVSPLSFLPKIVPASLAALPPPPATPPLPSSPPATPGPGAAAAASPASPNWTAVKANRAAAGVPLASLRRKEEMREMALLAEASRFIEGARGGVAPPPAPFSAPNAERLLAEVDAFLARSGNSSPRKKESPRKNDP